MLWKTEHDMSISQKKTRNSRDSHWDVKHSGLDYHQTLRNLFKDLIRWKNIKISFPRKHHFPLSRCRAESVGSESARRQENIIFIVYTFLIFESSKVNPSKICGALMFHVLDPKKTQVVDPFKEKSPDGSKFWTKHAQTQLNNVCIYIYMQSISLFIYLYTLCVCVCQNQGTNSQNPFKSISLPAYLTKNAPTFSKFLLSISAWLDGHGFMDVHLLADRTLWRTCQHSRWCSQ